MKSDERELSLEEPEDVAGGTYFECRDLENALIYNADDDALNEIYLKAAETVLLR